MLQKSLSTFYITVESVIVGILLYRKINTCQLFTFKEFAETLGFYNSIVREP